MTFAPKARTSTSCAEGSATSISIASRERSACRRSWSTHVWTPPRPIVPRMCRTRIGDEEKSGIRERGPFYLPKAAITRQAGGPICRTRRMRKTQFARSTSQRTQDLRRGRRVTQGIGADTRTDRRSPCGASRLSSRRPRKRSGSRAIALPRLRDLPLYSPPSIGEAT